MRIPAYWQPVVQTIYFGKYVRSAIYTRGGTGDKTVTWTTIIDKPGYYDIFGYIGKTTDRMMIIGGGAARGGGGGGRRRWRRRRSRRKRRRRQAEPEAWRSTTGIWWTPERQRKRKRWKRTTFRTLQRIAFPCIL